MTNKLYYKIGEICNITELKPSVLRFWEKEFKQLRPVKSGGGQRFYTKKHLDFIFSLKHMLYVEKLTIEGVRRKLSQQQADLPEQKVDNHEEVASNEEIKRELLDILNILKK